MEAFFLAVLFFLLLLFVCLFFELTSYLALMSVSINGPFIAIKAFFQNIPQNPPSFYPLPTSEAVSVFVDI